MKFKTDYETFRGAIATIGKAVKKNGINEMAVVKMEVKGISWNYLQMVILDASSRLN